MVMHADTLIICVGMVMVVLAIVVTTTFNEHNDDYDDDPWATTGNSTG
jgi:hypothetical protein